MTAVQTTYKLTTKAAIEALLTGKRTPMRVPQIITEAVPLSRLRVRWITRWKAAPNAFAITFEDRMNVKNN